MHLHFETSRLSFTYTSTSHKSAGSIPRPVAHPVELPDTERFSVVGERLHLKVSTTCRHTGSLTEKTSPVSSTRSPFRGYTLKRCFDRLLNRSDRKAFAYPQEECPRQEYPEAYSQPYGAELPASRSSQELSTFTTHELMGSQVFGMDHYATGPAMSQASDSTSASDNLSLNTAQKSNYTPETMSYGYSNDSPMSPETPRPGEPGHRRMSGFPDESAKALLFGNMDRRSSLAASHSSFEVRPTISRGDHMYNSQTDFGLRQDYPNPSAAYAMHAAQLNLSVHQEPWSSTHLSNTRGMIDPAWNNPLGQHSRAGLPQLHTRPYGSFYPIPLPSQWQQEINFNEYGHPQNVPQPPQVGFGVVDGTPNPPVSCNICNTHFTGKFAKGNLKRHLVRHIPLVAALKIACRRCEKVFKRADAARKHEWEKHQLPDTKPKRRVKGLPESEQL